MSEAGAVSAVTLRALIGAPLADVHLRAMVVANAHAIAERQGVEVVGIETEDDSVTIAIRGSRIEAIGLAAELRRVTERWYAAKHGAKLWGGS
jgi:CMP-2-keto-3-deoxyoctulosonic acid synthetase